MLLAVCFGGGDHATGVAIVHSILHILQVGLVGAVSASVGAGLPTHLVSTHMVTSILVILHLGLRVPDRELAVEVLGAVHRNGVVSLHWLHGLDLVARGLVLDIFTQI